MQILSLKLKDCRQVKSKAGKECCTPLEKISREHILLQMHNASIKKQQESSSKLQQPAPHLYQPRMLVHSVSSSREGEEISLKLLMLT